jgi:hypothetical protein
MNQQQLANLCNQIYRRFPEVAGCRPRVQNRPGRQVLLIFRSSAQTSDGLAFPRTVRVVASQDGKIVTVTTSH